MLETLSPFYAWGKCVSIEEQKLRFWHHERNRAKLMHDAELERKAHNMLKRFEEEGNVL